MIKDINEAREIIDDNLDYLKDSTYPEDTITELADSYVDVYTSDLEDWVRNEPDSFNLIEEAIDSFGWEGCNKSLTKAIQTAQFIGNEHLLYEAWEEKKQELEEAEEAEELNEA